MDGRMGGDGVVVSGGSYDGVLAEARGNPLITSAALHSPQHSASALQASGNLEGKEVRFGWRTGAVRNRDHRHELRRGELDAHSFTPLGGMVPLINLMLSEVIFGGVGAGMYGMLVFVILSVFIAGLMVGRTPEYLGKKIEAYDVKMAMLVVLIFPLVILVLTRFRFVQLRHFPISNAGPHGFTRFCTRLLPRWLTRLGFQWISGNTPWYNTSWA